jgi:hypothetical protein
MKANEAALNWMEQTENTKAIWAALVVLFLNRYFEV